MYQIKFLFDRKIEEKVIVELGNLFKIIKCKIAGQKTRGKPRTDFIIANREHKQTLITQLLNYAITGKFKTTLVIKDA